MDGVEALLNKTLYQNDDLGEGVDQTFSKSIYLYALAWGTYDQEH